MNQDVSSDRLFDIYKLLVQLRSEGDNAYHSLVNTFVLGNSILITAIAILLANNKGFVYINLVVVLMSIIGLFICFQMRLTQGVYTARNEYWERNLRIIESKLYGVSETEQSEINWNPLNLFIILHKVRDNPEELKLTNDQCVLPEVESALVENFERHFACKNYRKWWALRMKSLPWLFAAIYSASLIFTLIQTLTIII